MYSKNKIVQLTEDQSLVNLQVKRGEITKEEAKVSKQKNILLQCVGVKENIDIYNCFGELTGKEAFLLCSDGFYNKLDDKELSKLAARFRKKSVDKLELLNEYLNMVKSRRESDNISIVVINCLKKQFGLKDLFGGR